MRVIVATEAVVTGEAESPLYGPPGADHGFMAGYLEVFDEVLVVARHDRRRPPPGSRRLDGDGVRVLSLPAYRRAGGFLAHLRPLLAATLPLRREPAAIVLRVPSPVSSLVQAVTWGQRRPYAVEVGGDIWSVLAPGVVDAPARALLRVLGTLETRRLCWRAAGAAYVTRETLQRRYPPRPDNLARYRSAAARAAGGPRSLVTHYSTPVEPPRPRIHPPPPRVPNRLLFVGSLAQRYKGLDTLLRSLRLLADGGVETTLRVFGDGIYRAEMEALAARLEVADRVAFLGTVAHGLEREMAQADLFVLPSRTEGLPRVLLEAMAAGTPCVASAVGGIPELLPAEAMVPPDDAAALAALIGRVLASAELRARLVAAGAATVETLRPELQLERRRQFLTTLREATAEWLAGRSQALAAPPADGEARLPAAEP